MHDMTGELKFKKTNFTSGKKRVYTWVNSSARQTKPKGQGRGRKQEDKQGQTHGNTKTGW